MTENAQPWVWNEFDTRGALAKSLSKAVAKALSNCIAEELSMRPDADVAIAVSGGTTPTVFFNELAKQDIAWEQVIVTLVDERFVPPSSPRSNEGLVRRELLRDRAEKARFMPLYRDVPSVEEAADLADDEATERFASVVVLGMGLDGHTASLFIDGDRIAEALDPETMRSIIAIRSPSAPEPRLSMTLPDIATAFDVFLHIEGTAKREAFERAMTSEPALPIRAVAEAARKEGGFPIQVYWAP